MDTKPFELSGSIISRLAGNSFQLKAWSIALATAVIGFAAAKEGKPEAAFLAIVPCLAFWGLDAYYLGLERLYRALYEDACKMQEPSYSLKIPSLTGLEWFSAALSSSVVWLHEPMLILIAFVGIHSRWP